MAICKLDLVGQAANRIGVRACQTPHRHGKPGGHEVAPCPGGSGVLPPLRRQRGISRSEPQKGQARG